MTDTQKLNKSDIADIAHFRHKIDWEGRHYYWKHYRDTGMCMNCFDACCDLAENILETTEHEPDICDYGSLDAAESLLWNLAHDKGLLKCQTRTECDPKKQ